MDDGQIAESGTHDQLIANSVIYHGLWAVQTGKRL